jgi:flagellar L-ring protein precursor FlgH
MKLPSLLLLSAVALVLPCTNFASAQNNSLYAAAQQQPAMVNNSLVGQHASHGAGTMLADASWIYQSPMDRKTYEINDIVKVTVSVKSQMASSGKIDRKKTGFSDWKLTDWIKIYPGTVLGLNGGTNGQPPEGIPEIRGDLDSKLQAQGDLQSKDMLSFVISCHIVDKRPNGNLVLEGTWSICKDDEKWEYSLGGECRPEDIKSDNSILSDTIADLSIIQRDAGHVRDSYRRGWALEWLDKWQPF